MKLYNKRTSINWFGKGKLTPTQMKQHEQFAPMFTDDEVYADDAVVLLDNGNDIVYDWRWLSGMLAQYGIERTGDNETDFKALVAANDAPVIVLDPRDIPPALADLGEVISALAESQLEIADLVGQLVAVSGKDN